MDANPSGWHPNFHNSFLIRKIRVIRGSYFLSKVIARMLVTVIRVLIRCYQRVLSPLLKVVAGPGAGCRFEPTCSHYFLQAVELHGPGRGSWLGICRIFRCQPWGGSGYDPVPLPRATARHHHSCSRDRE